MGFALDVDVLLQIPVRNMKCLKPVFNVHRTVCKRITRILEILDGFSREFNLGKW